MNRDNALILSAIELIKADALFARENPENPVCPGCGRRDDPKHFHPIEVNGQRHQVCAECADQHTFNTTGCRFGTTACLHPDCLDSVVVCFPF